MTSLTYTQFRHAIHIARDTPASSAMSTTHGEMHWRAVCTQGLFLCAMNRFFTPARNAALLFGIFHDCRRQEAINDPEHGARGAEAFEKFVDATPDLSVSRKVIDAVRYACQHHHEAQVSANRFVGVGWDADRSVLPRVGLEPSSCFFSTVRERDIDRFLDVGARTSATPPDWDEIFAFSTRKIAYSADLRGANAIAFPD